MAWSHSLLLTDCLLTRSRHFCDVDTVAACLVGPFARYCIVGILTLVCQSVFLVTVTYISPTIEVGGIQRTPSFWAGTPFFADL
jgi:hypothetical protein